MWIRADDALWSIVKEIANAVDEEEGNMTTVMTVLLTGHELQGSDASIDWDSMRAGSGAP